MAAQGALAAANDNGAVQSCAITPLPQKTAGADGTVKTETE
jgi:hypothetical protein